VQNVAAATMTRPSRSLPAAAGHVIGLFDRNNTLDVHICLCRIGSAMPLRLALRGDHCSLSPRIVGISGRFGVLYLDGRTPRLLGPAAVEVTEWSACVAPCRQPHRLGTGCGVSSREVGLMVDSASPSPARIFVSYRREETAYPAGWLYERLADRYGGGQVFTDVDSIELGDDFVEVITTAVGSCDVLLALVGDQWLTITGPDGRRRLDDPDDFVRLEIEAALTRNVRVIPILVDGARMPRADELPPSLAALVRRQALELSPSRFDFDLSRLVKVLDRTLAEVRAAHDDVAAASALVGEAPNQSTTQAPPGQASGSDAPTAESDSVAELYSDPEYSAALAAYSTKRWDPAVDLLTRVLERFPDHAQVAERLAAARRHQQLTGWDADARQAAEQGRWAAAVAALEHISAAQPEDTDIAQRLKQARTQQEITSLQADLRRMHTARRWTAVVAIGEQLAGLDPKLADPDGLVSAAQLLQHEHARSLIEEHAEAPSQLKDLAAAPIPLLAPSPDGPAQPTRERRWLGPAIIAVAGVVAVVLVFAAFRPSDVSGTEGRTTSEPSSSSPHPPEWRPIDSLSNRVDSPGVAALEGKLWVVGGLGPPPENKAIGTVQVYDPKQGRWEQGKELPVPLEHAAVAADERTVYVVGGMTGPKDAKVVQNKVWMLADDQSWQPIASLPEPRYAGAAAWDGQRLVFAGGMTPEGEDGPASSDVYVLESPEDNGSRWVKLDTELQDARHHLAAATDGQGQVWFIGGREGTTVFGSVDIVQDDSITAGQDVTPVHAPAAVWHPTTGVCLLGGARPVEGGRDSINAVTCPGWPKLPEDRAGAGAAMVDDIVYLVGGYGDDEIYSNHVQALELG
jgi:TIR domain/Kelch motif